LLLLVKIYKQNRHVAVLWNVRLAQIKRDRLKSKKARFCQTNEKEGKIS